jgi:hypothetical protein
MEGTDTGARTGAIVGIVGGVLLAVGSFMTWATASVNVDRIAQAFGVDPSLLQGAVGGIETSKSITGIEGGDGWITLVAGLIVLGGAALALAARKIRPGGAVMVVGGIIGAGLAIYDATKAKDDAIDEITGSLAGQGLPGNVADFFNVSVGAGLWMCMVGGVVGVVGAIWLLARGADSATGSVADPAIVVDPMSPEARPESATPPSPIPVGIPPTPPMSGNEAPLEAAVTPGSDVEASDDAPQGDQEPGSAASEDSGPERGPQGSSEP